MGKGDRHPAAGIVLRAASPSDLDELVRLEETVFAGDGHRISRRQWRRMLQAHPELMAVAARGGSLVGALVLSRRAAGETLRVLSLGVDPEARGQGIGRALLDYTLTLAVAQGVGRVRLEVRSDNQAAIRLYRGAGFEEVTRLPSYYGLGEDALRMERVMEPEGGLRRA